MKPLESKTKVSIPTPDVFHAYQLTSKTHVLSLNIKTDKYFEKTTVVVNMIKI